MYITGSTTKPRMLLSTEESCLANGSTLVIEHYPLVYIVHNIIIKKVTLLLEGKLSHTSFVNFWRKLVNQQNSFEIIICAYPS